MSSTYGLIRHFIPSIAFAIMIFVHGVVFAENSKVITNEQITLSGDLENSRLAQEILEKIDQTIKKSVLLRN